MPLSNKHHTNLGDEIKLIVATASDRVNKVYFQESNRLVQDFEEIFATDIGSVT